MNSHLPRRKPGVAAQPVAAQPVAALFVLSLALSGCGSAEDPAGAAQDDGDGRLDIVASTDVWGSVVSAVGGDAVEVNSIIDDPSADPHSYESTPSEAAEVLGADLVVYNGGGYDEFMTQVLESEDDEVPAIEAFTFLDEAETDAEGESHSDDEEGEGGGHEGHGHAGGANEHVWYDLATVEAVAEKTAEQLGELDPDNAEMFTANAAAFHEEIDTLADQVAAIEQQRAGTRVTVTEPIAFHLIEAAGLDDVTPSEFVEAVEEESDPSAAAVAETRQLVADPQVAALIFNPQTETPVTGQVRSDAEAAGMPVVEMAETLPDGTSYVDWMSGQVDALETALRE
ncbi:MAG: ABC transporter [Pseudonocardiaceae bacterium]|nr:ABC transporter [Pseudonocardiaceae bacterium]